MAGSIHADYSHEPGRLDHPLVASRCLLSRWSHCGSISPIGALALRFLSASCRHSDQAFANGCHVPYITVRHSHSTGPKRNCRSQQMLKITCRM